MRETPANKRLGMSLANSSASSFATHFLQSFCAKRRKMFSYRVSCFSPPPSVRPPPIVVSQDSPGTNYANFYIAVVPATLVARKERIVYLKDSAKVKPELAD